MLVSGNPSGVTNTFVTIDTELSLGSFKRGVDLETNFARSILGECGNGVFGIPYQVERFNAHRLKAIYLVDPLPAAVFGLDLLRRTIDPILNGGHEVQLHIHTEWLPYLERSPVGDRRGTSIRWFDLADQMRLLEFAAGLLVAAGAPPPNAFRAGNYGANDDTLRALAAIDLSYDTSFNPAYLGRACRIDLPAGQIDMIERHGIIEVPVSVISEWSDRLRHAQLCAVSAWELAAGLHNAIAQGQSAFTVVLHSFELLSRDRLRANRTNVDRFEKLCALLADLRDEAPTTTFHAQPQLPAAKSAAKPAPGSIIRTAHRMAEQLMSHLRYEKPMRRA
jgi:hypothetical protein